MHFAWSILNDLSNFHKFFDWSHQDQIFAWWHLQVSKFFVYDKSLLGEGGVVHEVHGVDGVRGVDGVDVVVVVPGVAVPDALLLGTVTRPT